MDLCRLLLLCAASMVVAVADACHGMKGEGFLCLLIVDMRNKMSCLFFDAVSWQESMLAAKGRKKRHFHLSQQFSRVRRARGWPTG